MQNRRDLLKLFGAIGTSAILPINAYALGDTNRKFVFILQRGAADGLNTLIPYGDKNYNNLRPNIAIENAIKLDGFFGLHSQLSGIAKLYESKQASFVHAIASPYRERSHFDGQNILEGGFNIAYEREDGWLNRFSGIIAPKNPPISFTPTLPLALRGKSPSVNYSTSRFPDANNDLLLRLSSLYEKDAKLYDLWQRAEAQTDMGGTQSNKPEEIAKMIAGFMMGDKGANLVFIESQGWDTHSNQIGRMDAGLKSLDNFIVSLKSELDNDWQNTTILIATEFGRTAAQNGTGGTDHGTASCAMVLGGAIAGGKIIADWPGLEKNQLHEGRDLMPTSNLFGLISGLLGQTFNSDSEKIAKTLFPTAPIGRILTI